MKETIKINLAGVAFNIDMDAYEELKKYLEGISAKFNDSSERNEIIQDIEIRISEILQEKLGKTREVVNLDDVNQIIKIMGKPEDYDDQSDVPPTNHHTNRNRRIYRNPDNAILGGVSSGLGAYFDVDPIVFRVLFIVFCLPYGIGILMYLILWAALPKATSTVQKIHMKGEKITIENIEKNVKKEFETVKENISNYSKSGEYKKHSGFLNNFFHGIGKIIVFFAKFIAGIFAVALILAGFAGFLALLSLLFVNVGFFSTGLWGFESLSLDFFDYMIGSRANVILFFISTLLVVGIPLIMLIFGGFSIIFNFKNRLKGLGIFIFLVWVVSIFVILFTGAFEAKQFTSEAKYIDTVELNIDKKDTIYLHLDADDEMDEYISDHVVFEVDEYGIYWDQENVWGKPELDIYTTNEDEAYLTIHRKSNGPTKYKAKKQAKDILYDLKAIDNHIYFENFYKLDEDDKWCAQHINIKLYVPIGTTVFLGEDMDNILDHFNTKNYYSDRFMEGSYWKMEKKGFVKAEK